MKELSIPGSPTGGTDDFEPKFGLVPLIFGTIKGTIYALIIAIPIGILSALYTSQFLHSSLKKIIKPSIQFMAALPSMILGFLAGLWRALLMERVFPAIIIMPLFFLLFIAVAFCIWKCLPGYIKGKHRNGTEAIFLIRSLSQPFLHLSILVDLLSHYFLREITGNGFWMFWDCSMIKGMRLLLGLQWVLPYYRLSLRYPKMR